MSEGRDVEELTYREAVTELRAIIRGIESEDVDLDDLGARVERAAALIRACRATITRTEMSVRQVLDDLANDEAEGAAGGGGGGDGR